MLYDTLKILHIMSATLVLTSMAYSINLWITHKTILDDSKRQKIQRTTWIYFIPFTLFQLFTGFTMISIKQYDLSEHWIMGSLGGFIILMISWFAFLYFLISPPHKKYLKIHHMLQKTLLITSISTVLSMLFFMVNKSIL